MDSWSNRPSEVAYLLNPPFCGRLLYHAVRAYHKKISRPMPFLLTYLILPLVLHKNTRELITSRTSMYVWIQSNPSVLVNFADRVKSMIPITNEAVEFLIQSKVVSLSDSAEIELSKFEIPLSTIKFTNNEIKQCIQKSEGVAKWFAQAGTIDTIYINWGIRP